MIRYMLDTCICIYTIKNKPEEVRKNFMLHYDQMCISTVTLMELIYGTEKSAMPEKNLKVVEGFVARLQVLDFDAKAAEHTSQIRAELEKRGQTIGAYDYQIAGHARSQGLVVISNNLREFQRVPGLRIENWVSTATPVDDTQ